MTEDAKDIEIQYIKEKLIEIKQFLETFESKNCKKHQEILATTNQAIGRIDNKLEDFNKAKMTCSDFDNFLESHNRRDLQRDEGFKNLFTELQGNGGVKDKLNELKGVLYLYNRMRDFSLGLFILLGSAVIVLSLLIKDLFKKQ